MTNNDKVVRNYYYIILFFIVQMLLLQVYIKQFPIKNWFDLSLGVIIFFFNFISIFIIKRFYKTVQKLYNQRINELRYQHIEEQNKILRHHKHDLENHMTVISILAKERNYDELIKYLSDYKAEINQGCNLVNTGILELDVLLYSKMSMAKRENIKFHFTCESTIKCKNHSNIIHLVSIISNLLDNAIEACGKLENKYISLEFKQNPVDYILIIKNNFNSNEITLTNELFKEGVSTKGKVRGVGLSIVKELVEKYNGNISINVDEDVFKVQIYIPKHMLFYSVK